MKILPIINYTQSINSAPTKNAGTIYAFNKPAQQTNLNNMPHYITFGSKKTGTYETAKQYLEKRKTELKNNNYEIRDFDINKLEGIQEGIKVFEGLSINEIVFLISTLVTIATLRGCNNNCAHCFADAKPVQKETENSISRMDYEDFTNLIDGIKELHNRLGFSIIEKHPLKHIALFHDTDCSQIYLKDKDGNIHDWLDLAKTVYKGIQIPLLFDTAGWYIKDKAAQKRMERYVDGLVNDPEDKDLLNFFNISVNPYHAMYFKAVENMKKGDKEKENFFREKDSERMANTLFTLTPILKLPKDKRKMLVRAMMDDAENNTGFSRSDLIDVYEKHIFKKLEQLYEKDLNTEQKIIKNKSDIKKNLDEYNSLLRAKMVFPTSAIVTKKLKEIYSDTDPATQRTKKLLNLSAKETFKHTPIFTIIDANGDVYITNFVKTFKTDFKLNFKNKNKITADINPNLAAETISEEIVNKYNKTKFNQPGTLQYFLTKFFNLGNFFK